MKKILSFVLVLAMIASMMCVSVSAATHVVGTQGGTNGIEDGVAKADFSSEEKSNDVLATINGSVAYRYAVDLEYTQAAIEITCNAEWNVDTMRYDGSATITVGNAQPVTFDNAGTIANVASFTVTNYSNAAVYVATEVTSNFNTTDSPVTGEVIGAASVNAVTPVSGARANVVTESYTASLTCPDWVATFATERSDSPVTIASITFTFSKDAPTPAN